MKIQAAVVDRPGGAFRFASAELAPPKRDEVLVKITACGVCHTDQVAREQIIPLPLPAVLGHEGCGVILEVGEGVGDLRPGDRVCFSFGYCGVCEACRSGHPYACQRNRELNFSGLHFDGTRRLREGEQELSTFFGQGAFATHAVVHRNNLIPAPEDLPLPLLAPLGCGIQTGAGAILNYVRPRPGSSILISGCGAVGLSAVMAAKLAGCGNILACDVVPQRLELARELGADRLINARETPDVPAAVRERNGGRGVPYAVDCTGIGACVRASLNSTCSLGLCAVVGATSELTIHVENELMGQVKTLGGVVEGCCTPQTFIPELLRFYRAGKFPFDRLITYYPFREIEAAFRDTAAGKVTKAVLVMEGS